MAPRIRIAASRLTTTNSRHDATADAGRMTVAAPGGGRSPIEHRRLTLGMAVNTLLGKQVFDLVTRE